MTRYEFRPGSKAGRNVYVGSWTETACEPIRLPFSPQTLRLLLAHGANRDDKTYTHQQIANWCDQFALRYFDDPGNRERTIDLDVAEDVSAQWEMTLANTHSLSELQQLDFATFRLPIDWFNDWLRKLDVGPMTEGG